MFIMAGVKISALPAVASALLTDFFASVQGGITSKETLQQVLTLFNANTQIAQSQVTNLVSALASKLSLSGGTMTGSINMGGSQINVLGTPSLSTDAATKGYVDSIATGGAG